MKLKIAVVVHGRFHAFNLVRALLAHDHEVTVFTNYPKWAVKRFGIPAKYVESFWEHGILSRVSLKAQGKWGFPYPEAWLHRSFGRWAAKKMAGEHWDLVHSWSGVSEEILETRQKTGSLHTLMRGSAHIRVQAQLLHEEEIRTGVPQDQPSKWMIDREIKEYALTDKIVVLSSFCYNSFIGEGVPAERLAVILSGADTKDFHATQKIVEERCHRILSGAPLRILNVGTFSYRKGIFDLEEVIYRLHKKNFEFCFVGPIAPEAAALAKRINKIATFIPKQPQHNLMTYYNWGDVFILPAIEDGFQTVLAQAAAAHVPIITTPNGAGLDLIKQDINGWIVPIRNPDAITKHLTWCDSHRPELVKILKNNLSNYQPRSWEQVSANYEQLVAI